MMDNYLTAKEAATELGLQYSTLLARIRTGKVKATKRGWAVFIHRDEVRRVKNENHNRPVEKTAR